MKFKQILSGIRLSLRTYKGPGRIVIWMCGLSVIMRVAQPFLGILMPKVVLDQIEKGVSSRQFILVVGGMALALTLVGFVKALTDQMSNDAVGTTSIGGLMRMQWHKQTTMDYQNMEDPDYKAVEAKANKAFGSNHAPAMNIIRNLVELFANTIGFVLYALVISSVHPVILLVLMASAAISWAVLLRARKYDESTRSERSSFWKRLSALNEKMREPEAAKDLRLYSLPGWIQAVYHQQFEAAVGAERKVLTRNFHGQLTDAALILLRDGAAYGLLIWFVLDGRISLGTFVYVFAAIGALAGWITGILKAAGDLFKAGIEMSDIGAMLDYPDRSNRGEGIPLPDTSKAPPVIQLKNVGYTYPKAEKPTLSGVNVTIRPGESLAIVGANGAGKTTLVKLLCGLYQPTEGEVLVGNKPSTAYNRDAFFTLFSAVFQDIHFTANSIAENISQQILDRTDKERVQYCLELTGLADKVNTLPQKEHTLLVRSVNADAIELSGGEKQKLAMARAVYKDAPIVILDEPTAALDPIAENEVYQKYAQLTRGKSSVFISHRLASTRFCDRILLIDKGVIAESGSHDQLMAQGGIYANMFNIQASYYQDKGEMTI